jgi:hypothetical protein
MAGTEPAAGTPQRIAEEPAPAFGRSQMENHERREKHEKPCCDSHPVRGPGWKDLAWTDSAAFHRFASWPVQSLKIQEAFGRLFILAISSFFFRVFRVFRGSFRIREIAAREDSS